jgi:hypothetical protein
MKIRTVLGLVTISGLILSGVYVSSRWRAAASEMRELRITLANDSAAADASKLEIKREGDSALAVARRVAFQAEVGLREAFRDSVERIAHAAAQFRIEADSLRTTLKGERAERDSAGTITVTGAIDATDSLGVVVGARVTIPADLARPLWDWRIRRASIALALALSCEQDLAVAQLAGPPWARLVIDSVVQEPELCIPQPDLGWDPFRLEVPSLPVIILLFGLGLATGAAVG